MTISRTGTQPSSPEPAELCDPLLLTFGLDTFDDRDATLLASLDLISDYLEPWVETLLGQIQLPNGVQISVWAKSTPALFFRFDFYFPHTQKWYQARPDSGTFQDIWTAAKNFAEGIDDPTFEATEILSQPAD
jgi:hypothetical protein